MGSIVSSFGIYRKGVGIEGILGYIHCCNGRRKSDSYVLLPETTYILAEVDYLQACPVCGHTVVQLTRIDFDHNISICRKTNEKARKLFANLESSILYKKEPELCRVKAYSKFYLNYNEFGVKKKCYSNLSTLKIGLFEGESFNMKKNTLISSDHTLS
jgi:hypothetical protein